MQAVPQGGDEALLRQLAEVALAKLMTFEVEGLVGAAKGKHAPGERTTYRNGYRERPLHTRLGTLELRIPKLRQGTYCPALLEPRRLSERALTAVIQEAWSGGMSTRKVDDLVQALGMTGISKSQVSELCGALDERVNDCLERPLIGAYRYVWLDATYLKVRQGGRVVSVAAIIATGVNTAGRREGLGLGLGASEAREFWVECLRGLVRRGLQGVQWVVSEAHEGLKAAIHQGFNATGQRCRVHFMRNLLVCVPKAQQGMVAAAVRQVFTQTDSAVAHTLWRQVADQLRGRFPRGAARMDQAEDDVLAYLALPEAHRVQLHSTNGLERLNKEVKRRANVVGIFPNDASIRRLIGAILAEQNDEWLLQNRYLTLESLSALSSPVAASAPPALPVAA
jgi:transposase-like protein